MSARNAKSNSKEKFIKLNSHQYISPHSVRKNADITKLYTEHKNIYHETDYNISKNNNKQKINVKNLNKNGINIQIQKNNRVVSGFSADKNQQSHRKSNSKIYLKKNMIQNISALNYTEKSMNEKDDRVIKNRLNNIKFNIGKSSQNFLNSQISKANLKKNAESAYELLENNNNINNNYLKKSKTNSNNVLNVNNINQIGFIYTSGKDKKDEPISPPAEIKFLKNEKSKEEINAKENSSKEENKEGINCVIRNTYANVKIFPTTILNNKIIYQNNQNNNNRNSANKGENSNNTSSIRHNNSKIKKEKIIIDTTDKKQKKNNENFEFNSIEELHYFFIDTLQRGKKYALKLDKK